MEHLQPQRTRRLSTLSFHESGVARLVFASDLRSFEGVLINRTEEAFTLSGTQRESASFDVTVVDCESGSTYALRKIKLQFGSSSEIQLSSEALNFETDEVFVGNRADVEIRSYLNHHLVGKNHAVHVGSMTINFRTAITPPPTPSSYSHDSEDATMEEDFLK